MGALCLGQASWGALGLFIFLFLRTPHKSWSWYWGWGRGDFPPGAALGLRFGFVPSTGLMMQKCFASAELAQSQGLSCPSHGSAGEGFGSVWEVGRRPGRDG